MIKKLQHLKKLKNKKVNLPQDRSQKRGFYFAIAAILLIVLAFLLMWYMTNVELIRSGDRLPAEVIVTIHQPQERTIDMLYEITDTEDSVALKSSESIFLGADDRLVRLEKEFLLPEVLSNGKHTFSGFIVDREKPYVISEFVFYIVSPFVFWFFNSFLFIALFVLAILCVILAWFFGKSKKRALRLRDIKKIFSV